MAPNGEFCVADPGVPGVPEVLPGMFPIWLAGVPGVVVPCMEPSWLAAVPMVPPTGLGGG